MAGGRKKKGNFHHDKNERTMIKNIADLSAFEDFKAEVLPKIRAMLKRGAKPEEILEFAQSYAAARMVTIALTDEDSSKALTASKDVLDRQLGKAKERSEVQHKFAKLKEEEFDALLLSTQDAVLGEGEDDADTNEH